MTARNTPRLVVASDGAVARSLAPPTAGWAGHPIHHTPEGTTVMTRTLIATAVIALTACGIADAGVQPRPANRYQKPILVEMPVPSPRPGTAVSGGPIAQAGGGPIAPAN